MANAQKNLDTAQKRLAGECPVNYTNQYSESLAMETDDVEYGTALQFGTTNGQVKKFAAADASFAGVAARATAGSYANSNNDLIGYSDHDIVKVLKTGNIVVQTYEAVTPASVVRIAHTVGGSIVAADIGKFGDTASAGETVQLVGARYISSGDEDDLVEVFIPDSVTITADV